VRNRMFILLLALAATLAAPAVAGAQGDVVERAAQALRDAPVYQDRAAELALDEADLAALRREVEATGDRIFVAILPRSAGRPNDVTRRLARATERDGTFGIIVGNSFRAVSNTEPQRTTAAEATASLDEHRSDGAAAVLEDFVRRTAQPGLQAPAAEGAGNDGGGNGGGGAPWLLILLLAGGGLLALRAAGRGRRRRADEQAAFADVRGTAEADIAAIADDIRDLDDDVERAGAPPAAKEAYLRALDHYERADRALRTASTVAELRGVAETAADGRYEMAVARAHLEQREPPERRAPCFFDPRHGPSVADAEFAPPGGEARPVPVCAACATRLADGEEPDARSEVVGGRAMPYWAAPGAGYYGGAFGGFGPGLLGGLLIGSMFDGSAYAADHGDVGAEGFGGGDFGGGGFGGGDFGGGGFGGGDF
jgi:hypothetical protein